MKRLGEMIIPPDREGKEKHVPVIETPKEVKKGEWFDLKVTVGKEVPHPNTVEHHIKWVKVFVDEGAGINVANFEFGPTYAEPIVTFKMKLEEAGKRTLLALSYCNIHGLWDNGVEIEVKE